MGFDMHAVFQANKNAIWIDIASDYDCKRDYYLYSWLGMGGHIKPISEPRGFPADFHQKENQNLGEWGFSWLLGTEIIAAQPPVQTMKIEIPIDAYTEWGKVSNPKLWHELHPDWQKQDYAEHYATPENITEKTWWVIVDWVYDFTEDFADFVNEVHRLTELHGEVRFVFGFNA